MPMYAMLCTAMQYHHQCLARWWVQAEATARSSELAKATPREDDIEVVSVRKKERKEGKKKERKNERKKGRKEGSKEGK